MNSEKKSALEILLSTKVNANLDKVDRRYIMLSESTRAALEDFANEYITYFDFLKKEDFIEKVHRVMLMSVKEFGVPIRKTVLIGKINDPTPTEKNT